MSIYLYEAVCRSDSYDFGDWDGPEEFDTLEDAVNLANACVAGTKTKLIERDNFKLWIDSNDPIVAICIDSTIEDHREVWVPYTLGK
jgi:hypothetical protein